MGGPRRGWAVVLWSLLAWGLSVESVAPQSWPCEVQTSDRIVAVGDVHGAHDRFVAILRAARLVDERERWIGGRATLVQTGDVLDRGSDSRRTLELLRTLERDAARAGGRVIPLLGNHELMRIVGDWRYVSQAEYEAFRTSRSSDLRERALTQLLADAAARAKAEGTRFDADRFREQYGRETPLGAIEMRLAFDGKGDYGRWVRARPTVARVNGIVFLHGGVHESLASLGCAGINDLVRREMALLPLPPDQLVALTALKESGPLWYRGLALESEATLGPTVDQVLQRMQARAVVIGHTTVRSGRIATRFGGKVVQIDTGMLNGTFFPDGVPAALEIAGDQVTAVYLDRRETLHVPSLQSSAAR